MITFACSCGKKLQIIDDHAGKTVTCPSCGATSIAPPPKDAPGVLTISNPEVSSLASGEDESLDDQRVGEHGSLPHRFLRPAQSADELGRLGHFRVLKELGHGGMGAVYLAEDIRLLRQVALKVMLPRFASNAKSKERFLREARTAASIENDHIITIHEVDEDNGIPFLTMPVLKGESLQARLECDPALPIGEVLRIGWQICQGLQAAHERDLVHRDLKPGNLWLEGVRGRVKILDFGLARAVHTDQQLTQSGAIVGTPAYMAPEQARSPKVDGRADLFSLGVVLYRCLVGQAPFAGHDAMSVMLAICNDEPTPPGEKLTGIPIELNNLIMRLLHKAPDRRFASAEEVGFALEAIDRKYFMGQAIPGSSLPPATMQNIPIAQPVTMPGARSNVIPPSSSSDQPSAASEPGKATIAYAGAETETRRPRFKWLAVVVGLALCGVVAVVVIIWQIARIPQAPDDKDPPAQANGGKSPDKTGVKPPATEEPEEDDNRPFTLELSGLDPMRPLSPWDLPADAPKPAVFPFDEAQARAHQEAWANYLGKPLTVENKLGMKFVLIPPGEFEMVLYPRWDPSPVAVKRRTRLTDAFYLSTTHVTVEQFARFVSATDYKTEAETSGEGGGVPPNFEKRQPQYTWREPWDYPVDPKQPVTQVSRNDALAYCAWLSKQGKETFRLPTEAERYYVCRAGNTTKYGVTDEAKSLDEYQWLRPPEMANESPIRPVGLKKANPFGLFDINGNSSDWCLDAVGLDRVRSSTGINPVALNLSWDCQRGSQGFSNRPFTPEGRALEASSNRYCIVGFRVVREVLPRSFEYIVRPPLPQPGEPLSPRALVRRPGRITGLRSWSVELAAASPGSLVVCQPGGELVATAGFGASTIRLWDRAGKLKTAFVGHESWVDTLCWSPDGRHLASVSFESSLCVWDVETGRCIAKYDGNGPLPKVVFSPKGHLLAIGTFHGPLRILDPFTGIVRPGKEPLTARGICWAPDGSQLATASDDGKVRIWNASLQAVAELPFPDRQEKDAKALLAVAWSPDGKWIAASGTDHRIRIWDAVSHKHVGTIDAGYFLSLAWHKDGRRLASSGDLELTLWDALERKALLRFKGSLRSHSVAWTSDDRELVVLPIGASQPVFFDAASGKARQLVERPARVDASSWAVRPDGRQVSAVRDRNIRLFDADTGKLKDELPLPSLFTHQAWSPDGDRIALTNQAAADVPFTVLDLKTKKVRSGTKQPTALFNPTWSPDGRRIAVISTTEPVVRIYDADSGKPDCELKGHAKSVVDVLWTSDSTRLVTCGTDDTVRVWNSSSGVQVGIFRDPPCPLTSNPRFDRRVLVWRQQDRALLIPGNQATILRLNLSTGVWDVWDAWGAHSRYLPRVMVPSKDGRTISVMTDYYQYLLSPKERRYRYIEPTGKTSWFSDDQRMLIENGSDAQGYDTATDRRLGTLIPNIEGDQWLMVGPDGHYRGSKGIEKQIVYVALHDDGSMKTYTPAEFATRFGWKNEPNKATFLKAAR